VELLPQQEQQHQPRCSACNTCCQEQCELRLVTRLYNGLDALRAHATPGAELLHTYGTVMYRLNDYEAAVDYFELVCYTVPEVLVLVALWGVL
jgi:hypothetical protein